MFDSLSRKKVVDLTIKFNIDIGLTCKALLYWGKTRAKALGKNEDDVYNDYIQFWKKKIACLGLDDTIVGHESIKELVKAHEILPFTKSELDTLVTNKVLIERKDTKAGYLFNGEFILDLADNGKVMLSEFKEVYPPAMPDKNGVIQSLTGAPASYAEIYRENVLCSFELHDQILEAIRWMKENYTLCLANELVFYWVKQEKFIDTIQDMLALINYFKERLEKATEPVMTSNSVDLDELA